MIVILLLPAYYRVTHWMPLPAPPAPHDEPKEQGAPSDRLSVAQEQAVARAVLNIRAWLVQSSRYTASTAELDEVIRREINALLADVRTEPRALPQEQTGL